MHNTTDTQDRRRSTMMAMLLAALLFMPFGEAPGADNSWMITDAGGGTLHADDLRLQFSLGQPIVGDLSGSALAIEAGYLQPPGSSLCCLGRTGDFDGSGGEEPDIADLVGFVTWLFSDGTAPVCYAEANVDGDPTGLADISDLVRLVEFMFSNGAPPADCR